MRLGKASLVKRLSCNCSSLKVEGMCFFKDIFLYGCQCFIWQSFTLLEKYISPCSICFPFPFKLQNFHHLTWLLLSAFSESLFTVKYIQDWSYFLSFPFTISSHTFEYHMFLLSSFSIARYWNRKQINTKSMKEKVQYLMREVSMQSEQIPKLMIWKTQAVSYAHLDPMLHTKHAALKVEIT